MCKSKEVVLRLRAAAPLVLAIGLVASACSTRAPAQTPQPQPRPDSASRAAGPQPKPYARVITREARTRTGLFKTHQIGDKVFFEIPQSQLGRDMLAIVRTNAGGPNTGFFGGGPSRVVAWERSGDRILLRARSFGITADSAAAIARAVAALNAGPIIASFAVESWGPDSAAVIDATKLFNTNIPEFTAVTQIQADRTFIDQVTSFPENVNVLVTQTGLTPPPQGSPPGTRPTTVTQQILWSMAALPDQAMRPRLHDRRIGLGSVTTIDYSRPEHEATSRRYVRRFRLEKKNPQADVSDPVEPVIFWIDPATPEWLVPYVKKGVDAWQVAFEEAGFSNAIFGREAPPNDPDFSMYDVRHSAIYWRPSTVANATGGQLVDPRSGEIIKAEVNMYHNVMNLLRNWYFTQVGPLDVRAQRLPLPDSLMGRLVEYVVAHEVGHAIGFPHNMKASAMYPADSIRSRTFLERMGGHVATLMDYSRFNYVAQPEDSIPPHLLVPGIGPYDKFAVMWQLKPIPSARTPDDEKRTLDAWARAQDSIPWLRYETQEATADPHAITEAVGDEDAVKSNTLGLRNLQRVMRMLIPVAERPGEDYELLEELYSNAVGQWGRYNAHVAAIIGGAESQERYGTGPRFTPLPESKQREAMRFLAANAFTVPSYFIDTNVLRRIEQEGIIPRLRNAQLAVLNSLLSDQRLNRLVEYEALAPRGMDVFTLPEMLTSLRGSVWTELTARNTQIDVYRRNLQRAYLEAVERTLYPPPPPPASPFGGQQPPRYNSDVRPALRGELIEIDRMAQAALARASDPMTRLHLRDVRLEIERLLAPPQRTITTR